MSCPVLFCLVLSCSVLSYLVLSCLDLSCPVLSCPVLSCPVLSCAMLSCPFLSCLDLSCPVLCCAVLSCLDLSCPLLTCPVLSCPMLSCLDMSCPDLFCPILSYAMLSCPFLSCLDLSWNQCILHFLQFSTFCLLSMSFKDISTRGWTATREHRIETTPWNDLGILISTDLSCCCLLKLVRKNWKILKDKKKINDNECVWIFNFLYFAGFSFHNSFLLFLSLVYHLHLLTNSFSLLVFTPSSHWICFWSVFALFVLFYMCIFSFAVFFSQAAWDWI